MNRLEVQNRAMIMALNIIKLTKLFPYNQESKIITSQIIRSSTSVAANYRSSGRAKSTRDFIAKLGIAEEECDETNCWLEFALHAKLASQEVIQPLINESSEILAIIAASRKTAKQNLKNK